MNGTITLHGEKNAEAVVYTNAVEAGNKLIANTGKFNAYGKPRLNKMSRLTREALKNTSSIFVEPGLDWYPGDMLGLMATSYDSAANDDVTISTYDNVTGEITFNTTLNYYHYGRSESTASLYNGVDIRGEVVLLTRNVKIQGEDIESWGGQISTGFFIETDLTMRAGQTYFDNVEIYNCSQIDTSKAALRWESNVLGNSSVTNSTIHNGYSWAVNIQASSNVVLQNNVFWSFRPLGVVVKSSQNITIDNNIVGKVVDRTTFAGQNLVDFAGAYSICALSDGRTGCDNLVVTNNIAGGSVYCGFCTIAEDCDGSTSMYFRNNVGHSIKGIISGHGLIVGTNPSKSNQLTCF
jgi:hypothetical protein